MSQSVEFKVSHKLQKEIDEVEKRMNKEKFCGFFSEKLWKARFQKFPGLSRRFVKEGKERKMKHFAELVHEIAPRRIIFLTEEQRHGIWEGKIEKLRFPAGHSNFAT